MRRRKSVIRQVVLYLCLTLASLVLLSQFGPRSPVKRPTPSPATNGTSTPTLTSDVLLANTTVLSLLCQSECQGGSCNQTEVGTTTCTACADGFTLQDGGSCLDMRACYAVPWCTPTDRVDAVHQALLNATLVFLESTNSTRATSAVMWPALDVYDHTAHDGSNATRRAEDLADLANAWIEGRLLMGNDTRSITSFFDDTNAYWSASLDYYFPPPAFRTYIDTLKSRICVNNWRPSSAGFCVAPTEAATVTCARLTVSELAQNGNVCIV